MNFLDAVKTGFIKTFQYSGRAPRSEYWYWTLFSCLLNGSFAFVDGLQYGDHLPLFCASNFTSVLTLLPTLSNTTRRLHDLNYSGWWQVTAPLVITAIIAAVFFALSDLGKGAAAVGAGLLCLGFTVFVMSLFCKPGTVGANRYGQDPLAPNQPLSPPSEKPTPFG
jgi:uncharacterized membrane protein YhaH (DUF805 family)